MSYFLGIDVGSTSITSVIIEMKSNSVVKSTSIKNSCEVTSSLDRKIGRSEWDIEKMFELVLKNTANLIKETNLPLSAIGVTGQQQGLQLLDEKFKTVGNFISWQDQRSKELLPNNKQSYLELMGEIGGAKNKNDGLPSFENTGCPIVTGYTVPILFWLIKNSELGKNLYGTTAPEYVVSKLTEKKPVTDPTDAASWGVYDIKNNDWNFDLIDSLGINRSIFSEIKKSCTVAGRLDNNIAKILGTQTGIPVSIASGDHQCSFAGTVADYKNTVAINIGTGGQSTVYLEKIIPRGWLEIRPFIESGYLLAGVGVVGGRTFRVLKDFFLNSITSINSNEIDSDSVYTNLVKLASTVPKGSEGVIFDPLFTGSRKKPSAKGAISGLTPSTFTTGHLTRALFEAIAEQLLISYKEAINLGAGKRDILVGSGNGIKLNQILKESLESKFQMKMNIGKNDEEAAIGAALCAAVAEGSFKSISEASEYFI